MTIINLHELSGLAEKMERMEVCIDAVDVAEDVDEPALHSLVSNVDIHIGVDQIGILKSRIQSMMSEGDMKVCLHLLTLFVRISTVRLSLLFRMITCLKTNNYGKHTSASLQKYIEKERADGEQFLLFFSGPSLRNVGILAVIEPAEQIELTTYLEYMHIPLKDLRKVLDGRTFLIQPLMISSILLGRPFPSKGAARAMKNSQPMLITSALDSNLKPYMVHSIYFTLFRQIWMNIFIWKINCFAYILKSLKRELVPSGK